MEFNNGNERRKLNKKWERLRVQYQQAGMSEDAIQAMYDFDLGVLNSERSYVANTLAIVDDGDDSTGRKSSDFKQYEKAIAVTDTYHETRTRFAWVGEIKDKRLQEGLEKLSDEELRLITLYFRDEYSTVELSKVYGIAQQNISKRMRLKNTADNFSASFHITPPYQMVVIHSSKLIYPRELYQRGIQRKRVELIAKDFNEYTANEPKVSFRNGRYYVTDGQHTIEARILRNGGKDLPILCKIYTGLTMQQEALFFAEQNGHAAPLTAGIKLRAKVVGEDAPSVAFLAATNRVGLDFNYDSLQLSDYRISCVGTALKLYNQMGEKIYCEALRLIVAAWEGKPDSFRASVLRGMMHFVELYHGEFSEERLIRALRSVHPMEIYRSGMDNPAKLPGWKKYVFPIYMAYNGKCRKDALPMKF